MTAYVDIGSRPQSLPSAREAGLWVGAGLVVMTTYAMIAYAVHTFVPAEPSPEAAQPAMVVELTPLPVSQPESVQSETLTEERTSETVPVEETPEIIPETAEPAEAAPAEEAVRPEAIAPETLKPETTEPATQTAEPETVAPETPEVEEPETVEPELAPEVAEAVTPDVAVPLPQPRPIVEENPKQAEPARRAEKPASKKAEKEPSRKEVAKAEPKPTPKSNASTESRASKAPTISPAKWQSKVLAWLNRHKRYPRGARSRKEEGMVRVAFAIDEYGAVLSARIARSSGNSELDQAALDMVRRASPVPPPPPEVARNITVPVQFSLR
ncbi:TonB family protein [Mesorhizobium sp. BAC0120]|uniref:TonB family protein n=1 Tax=Mesorhizobium sp. BAC0120 TaxID=3090670 RepID=UPI00298BF99E|nr:TonB family protein [Mesorhizobium sp. BAC0120]MDW6025429.1 TonB family protein [Mesorhizobium sp. BAC0120]